MNSKMPKDNLTAAILWLRKDFEMPPEEINQGLCADFADMIWRQHPKVEVLSDQDMGSIEYTHTFLYFEGKYYDAERPKGVKNWQQLPIFQRHDEELQTFLRHRK